MGRRRGFQLCSRLPHHIFGMGSLCFLGMVRVAGCLAGEDTQMLLQAAALGSSWYKSSASRLCLRGIQQQQATRQITPGPGLKHRAPGEPWFASLRGGRGLSPSCSGRGWCPRGLLAAEQDHQDSRMSSLGSSSQLFIQTRCGQGGRVSVLMVSGVTSCWGQ